MKDNLKNMLSKDEIDENFELAAVACDKTIQSLRSIQIKDEDVRLSFFYKLRTLHNMFRLSYGFYDKYLLTQKYWEDNFPDFIMSNKNMNKICDEYDMFLRSSFITELYSAFESSFRIIIHAANSQYYDKHKRNFSKMAEKILNDLKLSKEYPLIRHFSLIRNSIHSNGIFDPLDGKNTKIEYKNKTFTYTVGRPVEYTGWIDLLSISKLIHYLFFFIVEKLQNQHILFIKEPASDFWSKLD